jgi:hypothetical protein
MTTYIALYAALLSTVVLVWDIIKYRRERPRLQVSVAYHVREGASRSEPDIQITMVNRGKRPISVVACGFRLETRSECNTVTLPVPGGVLTDGQARTAHADLRELRQHGIEPRQILFAWARDATGQEYRSNKHPFTSHRGASGREHEVRRNKGLMQDISKALEEQMEYAETHPLPKPGEMGRGRKRGAVSTSNRGSTQADYLARRIARDRPETRPGGPVAPRSPAALSLRAGGPS